MQYRESSNDRYRWYSGSLHEPSVCVGVQEELTLSSARNANLGLDRSLSLNVSSNPLPWSFTLPATALTNFVCSSGIFASHFSTAEDRFGGGERDRDENESYEFALRLLEGDRELSLDIDRLRRLSGLGDLVFLLLRVFSGVRERDRRLLAPELRSTVSEMPT